MIARIEYKGKVQMFECVGVELSGPKAPSGIRELHVRPAYVEQSILVHTVPEKWVKDLHINVFTDDGEPMQFFDDNV